MNSEDFLFMVFLIAVIVGIPLLGYTMYKDSVIRNYNQKQICPGTYVSSNYGIVDYCDGKPIICNYDFTDCDYVQGNFQGEDCYRSGKTVKCESKFR